MDISGTQLRALRATLFTALVVTLSAASHVVLSRAPLPLLPLLAVAGAVFALSYGLAGRERGFWHIAALLVPLELAADTVLTTGQHVCYGPAGGPVAGPLRSFGIDVLCGGGPVGTPLSSLAGGEETHAALLLADPRPGASWVLLGAHLAVGLLAAAWLRRGERALAQSLAAFTAFAFRPLLLAVAFVTAGGARAVRAIAPRPARAGRRPHLALLAHSLGRRGPPAVANAPA
ncbi:hypothetical protein AB0J21_13225 [Streptomyces sp. NPDC049954]|uniref:hypothetical protein n=1 Tax=Streptomyces sp. NPDC049954 TaxID=3155779 RepID=UPI0034476C16